MYSFLKRYGVESQTSAILSFLTGQENRKRLFALSDVAYGVLNKTKMRLELFSVPRFRKKYKRGTFKLDP